MVYNDILMETIGIPVMVSIGLLLFFYQGFLYLKAAMWGLPFYESFSKLYLNIYVRYLNILLNGCQLKFSFKILTLVMLLF